MGQGLRTAVAATALLASAAVAILALRSGAGRPPSETGVESSTARDAVASGRIPSASRPSPPVRPAAGEESSPTVSEEHPPPPCEGYLYVRIIDSRTRRPPQNLEGIAVAWDWVDPAYGEDNPNWEESPETHRSGWVAIDVRPSSPRRNLRILLPGYRPAPLDPDAPPADRNLLLEPDPAAVRGVLVPPAGEHWQPDGFAVLDARDGRLASAHPNYGGLRMERVRVAMDVSGPFVLSIPEKGEWILRAQWQRRRGAETFWSTRRFRTTGAGVDLGDVLAAPGVSLRARLVAGEAERLAKGPELVALPVRGGAPVAAVGYGERRAWPRLHPHPRGFPDPWDNARPDGEPAGDGWWEWTGFLPGSEVVLAAPSFPGTWKAVRLPSEPGAVVSVELDARGPRADCVLHLRIDGKEPTDWGAIVAGPCYDEDFRSGIGLLEASVPVGTHRIVVAATLGEEDEVEHYEADLDVAAPGRFETTVDLKPVQR